MAVYSKKTLLSLLLFPFTQSEANSFQARNAGSAVGKVAWRTRAQAITRNSLTAKASTYTARIKSQVNETKFVGEDELNTLEVSGEDDTQGKTDVVNVEFGSDHLKVRRGRTSDKMGVVNVRKSETHESSEDAASYLNLLEMKTASTVKREPATSKTRVSRGSYLIQSEMKGIQAKARSNPTHQPSSNLEIGNDNEIEILLYDESGKTGQTGIAKSGGGGTKKTGKQ